MDKTYNQDVELSLKLLVVLNRALEAVKNQVVKDIKNYNLNLTEFAVLELLYHKGDQPIQKIGDKVLLASSSITYVVDKLEKKDLIERKPCATDRRITYAALTEKGKVFMDEIFPKHATSLQKIFAGLETEEKAAVINQLKKLGYYAEGL
ncbi:MarR family winged helix-turn-helix transcriptional regulator [Bacillus litorisediminis]|uniref:MarR family winged helix-turn-helix transcriptional regulator n=1 Tax=Bacillus litorisediminis TaxID=2922713 RepID=UPI001FAB8459|nr:MarR family transcriptional regulator [Bacillus litorisediminis]